ncbi:MAG: SDR family NAD(P)-dependent oxidoreductase [Planctomycetota bacterium]
MRSPWGLALDASIYFSFDASGYRRHARGFDPDALDVDLRGQRCLVSGANSGIGFATAEALARRGAEVWLLCRNPERGRAAEAELRRRVVNANVRLELLDLSDLVAIREWVASCPVDTIDALVHNAGVLPHERQLTSDGLETTFATHVAGPFLLTRLLRERLEAAPAGRVIWVSSGGMYSQRLSLSDLEWARRRYDGVAAYAQTKRMQVVLSELFAQRWGGRVCFSAMHPGWADTPAVQTSLPGFWKFTKGRLRTPEQGADTVIWLALGGAPPASSGEVDREELWELCERVCGLPHEASA